MQTETFKRAGRGIALLILAVALSGCVSWLRAYQTYLQMDEFDRYFSIAVNDEFTLHFKEPILYSQDFVTFAKLYASDDSATQTGRRWRYWFRKVDGNNKIIKPEIKFYADLDFNKENRLTDWSFSQLFLQIAPAKFLEVSLRSIGGAEIDEEKQQLKAKTEAMAKISEALPKKQEILANLGKPISIRDEKDQEVYIYHFLLETPHIEAGYEENALNEVKLSFDKKTQELTKMAGNFAGLKVSINYRNFLDKS